MIYQAAACSTLLLRDLNRQKAMLPQSQQPVSKTQARMKMNVAPQVLRQSQARCLAYCVEQPWLFLTKNSRRNREAPPSPLDLPTSESQRTRERNPHFSPVINNIQNYFRRSSVREMLMLLHQTRHSPREFLAAGQPTEWKRFLRMPIRCASFSVARGCL